MILKLYNLTTYLLIGLVALAACTEKKASDKETESKENEIKISDFSKQQTYDYDELEVELDSEIKAPVVIPTASVVEKIYVRPPAQIEKGQRLLKLKPLNPIMNSFILKAPESALLASFDTRVGQEIEANKIAGYLVDPEKMQGQAFVPVEIISRLKNQKDKNSKIRALLKSSTEKKGLDGDTIFKEVLVTGYSTRHDEKTGLYKIYIEATISKEGLKQAIPSFWTLSLESNYKEVYAFKDDYLRQDKLLFLDPKNKIQNFAVKVQTKFKNLVIPNQKEFLKFLGKHPGLKLISDFSRYPKEEDKLKIVNSKNE